MSTNGIDFVIGGKDQAKPAMASVEQSLQRMEAKTDKLAASTVSLTKVTGGLVAAWATVNSTLALIGGLDTVNAAYDEHATAVKDIEVALKLQGAAVDAESARLQKYAESVQSMTGMNDSAVMTLMKEASLLGVTSDKLDDMTTAALGLAEATGQSASGAMTTLRMATEGNFEAFNRTIPQIKTMTTNEEKLAAVLELAARGFEAKATWSDQVAESGGHAGIAIDKLMESVGSIIAPFRVLISTGIETAANALSGLLAPAAEYATSMLENMGPMIEWVKEKLITGVNAIIATFTFFEVALTHIGDIWTIVVSSIELYLLQIAGAIAHTLTEVIPGYIMWFGENIINLFQDAFNGVLAVFDNSTRMIAEIMSELWTFIFEDMGEGSAALGDRIGAILASGITTGFKSSLTDLPTIAGRTITDREKELAETIGQLGANIGDEFNRKMQDRMIGIGEDIGDGLNTNIDLSMANSGLAKRKDGTTGTSINATESRLLTRGPSSTMEKMLSGVEKIGQILTRTGEWVRATKDEIAEMNRQDPKKVRFVAIK